MEFTDDLTTFAKDSISMDMIVKYGTNLIAAIAILIVGFWLTKQLCKVVDKSFKKRGISESLRPFLIKIISVLLKIVTTISALDVIGIEMTSFIALLGAAGLAVGMALSGTLQNFAGGIMILILRPFKNGDLIEAQGFLGIVQEIQIFSTRLTSLDNKAIFIPNGPLANSPVTNYSREETRRVDWVFGISYSDSFQVARDVLKEMIESDSRVLKDPSYLIALGEMGDSSVNITVRAWVKAEDYWGLFFEMNERVYAEFPAKGLSIPFPQMDVHVKQ